MDSFRRTSSTLMDRTDVAWRLGQQRPLSPDWPDFSNAAHSIRYEFLLSHLQPRRAVLQTSQSIDRTCSFTCDTPEARCWSCVFATIARCTRLREQEGSGGNQGNEHVRTGWNTPFISDLFMSFTMVALTAAIYGTSARFSMHDIGPSRASRLSSPFLTL